MQDLTVIDAPDFTISTPRDEELEGFNVGQNYKILFLPIQTSEKFPNLIAYAASSCSIRTVRKENFQSLNKLKKISLDDNQIETIESNTFEDLTDLIYIGLSDNINLFYCFLFDKTFVI